MPKRKDVKKKNNRESVQEEIHRYGSKILQSEEFKRAASETHHLHGTVSQHTLTVCHVGLQISRFLNKIGFRVNEEDVIHAALCHDLGMVGRDEKYKSRTTAWKDHPDESIRIAHDLLPDLTPNAESMIRTHMWPVSGPHPRSREAVILNLADKIASAADWESFLFKKKND